MSNHGRRPAVFLDRDGTLSEEIGYVNHPARFVVYPWAAAAVRLLNQAGFATVVLTNQSGVARGYFSEELVGLVHQKLREEITRGGGRLDAIYYCPHHPEGRVEAYRQHCRCRKPDTGMIERAAAELELDLSRSFVVGDRYLEVEMARRAGLPCVFVLSGYGLGEYDYQRHTWSHLPTTVVPDVLAAAKEIVKGEVGAHGRAPLQNGIS